MHYAADGGHTACCIILKELGADYEVKSIPGAMQPIHLAAAGGHEECFLALVKMGVSVNVLDKVLVYPFFSKIYYFH